MICCSRLDFMAVRKIPLKEQPYLYEDGSSNALGLSDKAEDPTVVTFQSRIRKTLLTDRALHDKVCSPSS
jgi:ATP-dependent RNA helicase DDX55/SPB4